MDGVPPFFLCKALGGSGAARVQLASRPLGSPGPGLRELRQRAALLGRWLVKSVGTAVAESPQPSLAPSRQAIFKKQGLTVIQSVSELTVCEEKREAWHC